MRTAKIRYPTFIGIGGMKCGTTWLSECLRYHPEIFMSAPKELHYFASRSKRDKGVAWYLEHFRRSDGYKATGEFSASYLQRPDAAGQMKNMVGNVKILVMLRDPVDRFISHYKQLIRNGVLPKEEYSTLDTKAFQRAVEISPKLLGHGNYHRNLISFVDTFGIDNIYILFKEDIDKNPRKELEKVFGFLEVDQTYLPPIVNTKVSTGIVPRFPSLESLRIRLFRKINKNAPRLIVYSRRLGLAGMYRKLNSDTREGRFEINSEVTEKLCLYYRDEIHGVEHLLGRKLDTWKKSPKSSHSQAGEKRAHT